MNRRDFLATLAIGASGVRTTQVAVVIPVHRIVDARAKCKPEELRRFWWSIWPEAYREFHSGGIQFQTTDGPGEIRRTAADIPIFEGLRRGVLNLVLTDSLPLYWDSARALAGVSTIYQGYHLCLIALRYAHGNQVPFISVNTCVHEFLHVMMQDIFVAHPRWYQSAGREMRIDAYATRLWLFGDGSAIRRSAKEYVERLRTS
jgi:hypothetical protein